MLLLAKVLGFGEKVALAHFEGASASIDAYFTAVGVAFFFFVLVDDIVVPVFLSQYVRLLERDGVAVARAFFRRVAAGTLLGLALLAGLAAIRPEGVLALIAPGFEADRLALAVPLVRLALPAGVLLGIAALTYVVLNAHRSFAWPAFTGAVYKAVVLLAIVLLLPRVGIVGAALGLAAAAAVQLGLQLLGLRRHGPGSAHAREARVPAGTFRVLLPLMLPLAIGTVVAQASGFVDNAMGSTLETGAIAALGYARRLVDLPILLVPGVLGIVAFPRLAALAARGRLDELAAFLARLIEFCSVVFLPVTALFLLSAPEIVGVVFERGAFDAAATMSTSLALRVFSIALVVFAVEILLLRAFYALLDTWTPILVGLVFVALNVTLTVTLTPRLGLVAIPLALAVQKSGKVLVLLAILGRRLGGSGVRWRTLSSVAIGAALFAAVGWLGARWTPEIDGTTGHLLRLAAFTAPAALVYLAWLHGSGVVDLRRVGELRRLLTRSGPSKTA
jgi:putative peptidoglycan lipid II flippase